ncbi:MAG TPA: hemolysin family protein, partial [Rhizomicrobium sp.]|nr:hemolysin family protein [Rhizomicrobium sp.]
LGLFLFAFRPAISALNGLGNMVLRLFGLSSGGTEETLHSAQELKMLVKASHEAGILEEAQQEVLVRTLTIGERRVGDIMTPRVDVDWIDASLEPHELLAAIRDSKHDHLLVSKGSVDEPMGILMKADLLNQFIDGGKPDPLALVCEPLVLHEATPVFKVLDLFKASPKRLAMVVDEYGTLEGILTQTDLLEAIAGELPENEGKSQNIVVRDDGSIVMAGPTPAHDAFDHLQMPLPDGSGSFHTVAGFALHQFDEIPQAGDRFTYQDWEFEVAAMDGRRIETLIVRKKKAPAAPHA